MEKNATLLGNAYPRTSGCRTALTSHRTRSKTCQSFVSLPQDSGGDKKSSNNRKESPWDLLYPQFKLICSWRNWSRLPRSPQLTSNRESGFATWMTPLSFGNTAKTNSSYSWNTSMDCRAASSSPCIRKRMVTSLSWTWRCPGSRMSLSPSRSTGSHPFP